MTAGKIRLIIIFGLFIIVMGFFMAPTRKEVALMRLEDKNFNDAFEYYKKQYIKDEKSINVLAPLIKIYIYYGHVDKAIALLELYVQENPGSIEGRKELTALYKSAEYYYKYCDSLEELQKMVPSTKNLRELASTYSFLGKHEEEMSALDRLIRGRNYHPMEEDYVRLASLYMADHQQDEKAIEVLLNYFDKDLRDTSISTVHMAVQVLADNGLEKKAFYITENYLQGLKKDEKESNAIVLSGVFSKQSQQNYAFEIIKPYFANLDNSPQLLQRKVEIMMDQHKEKEVYEDLKKRFTGNRLPNSLEVSLLDLAMQYFDHKLFEDVFQKASIGRISEDSLIRYADYITQYQKPAHATLMKNVLGKEYLEGTPLLTALIDIAETGGKNAVAKLAAIPLNRISLEQKMQLVSIYVRYNEPERAYALIEGMTVADTLYVVDPAQYAKMYLNMNQADAVIKKINAEKESASPEMKVLMDQAVFMVNVGRGYEKFVLNWLSNNKDVKATVLEEAYSLAYFYKHYPMALNFAQKIYKMDPNSRNQIELAEALMLNYQFENALKLLQPLVDKEPDARMAFLNGMGDWVHKTSDKQKTAEKIEKFSNIILSQKDLTKKEKQDMAYLLIETGSNAKAENLLLELAANKPYGDPDVAELLGFWGDKLSGRAIEWVQNKANSTTGDEQASWLSYANDTDNPQIVLAAVNGREHYLAPAVADQYINALIAMKNYDALREAVNRQIEYENSPERLLNLASIAIQENLPDVSANGWRKLNAVSPGNPEALKELGLLAFSLNKFTEAQSFLEKYLNGNKGDYRINSAYGEILLRKGKNKQASGYFDQAMRQLAAVKTKTVDEMVAEAFLLYRSNRLNESIALYKKILADFPDNKSAKTDFIQVLIDNKQFKEASLLLSK